MTRFATIAIFAIALIAASTATADAAQHRYELFQIHNHNDVSIKYEISWDAGSTWDTHRIGADIRTVHSNRITNWKVLIRFDGDFAPGYTKRQYELDVTHSSYEPDLNTSTNVYEFVIGGDLIDLRG